MAIINTMMRILLYTAGILLLLNVILLSFVSNVNLGFVMAALVAIALVVYAHFFGNIAMHWHIIIGVACLIPLCVMVFLFVFGGRDTATFDEDAVIVLGAGIHGERVSLPLARRLDIAIAYHKRNPDAVIVVTGGQGRQELITEALAMERYLVERGVPQDRILQEDKSTSTLENLAFAKAILDEYFGRTTPENCPHRLTAFANPLAYVSLYEATRLFCESGRVLRCCQHEYTSVVITSDFHIYRASRLARQAGLEATHMGAHTAWFTKPVNYLREVLAVFRMWVLPARSI